MDRWIAIQISDLGTDSPLIEGNGEIKKVSLHFAVKFWWTMERYKLSSTSSDNILTWDRATLVGKLLSGYDVDFAAPIWLEIHVRAFDATTTLFFLSDPIVM